MFTDQYVHWQGRFRVAVAMNARVQKASLRAVTHVSLFYYFLCPKRMTFDLYSVYIRPKAITQEIEANLVSTKFPV